MAKRAAMTTAPAPTLEIPIPPDGRGSVKWFRGQIDSAERRKKKILPTWRLNIERYQSEKPKLHAVTANDTINVNTDFWNTEQKKAQLFYQTPTIEMTSKDGTAPPPPITVLQKIVNYYLGPNEIKAERMMDEVLFDTIVPAGLGPSVIGFEEVKVTVDFPTGATEPDPADPTGVAVRPVMEPDPADPSGQQLRPQTAPVKRRIWSRFFWERISPANLLIPSTFLSLEFDKAPWLGYWVPMDEEDAGDESKPYRPASRPSGAGDDSTLAPKADREFIRTAKRKYFLWYRASWLDPTVKNPELFRRLVLVDAGKGEPEVIAHDAPYQEIGPAGELVKGMRGNPIHIFTLRPIADTAYPNSDSTQGRPSADEVSTGRSQMVTQRKRNIPLRAFDKNGMSKNEITQMENAEIQGLIGVRGDPDKKIKTIAQATLPAENFRFSEIAMNDNRACWGLGANAQSLAEIGGKTATEIATIQAATETRLTKERNRILGDYTGGGEKLSALVQLKADVEMLTPIVGAENAQLFMSFDWAAQAGRYQYTLRPDSSIRIDAAEDFNRDLRTYNLVAKDPYFDRRPLLLKMATARGLPATVVVQPPQSGPEPPNITVSIPSTTLILPEVQQLLAQRGITITTQPLLPAAGLAGGAPPTSAIAPRAGALPPDIEALLAHGGSAAQAEMISKHEGDRTSKLPGPGPM